MSNFLDQTGLSYFWQSIKSKFLRGNAGGVFYGTCSTAAGTVAKVVECADFTADNLKAGTIIIVTFTKTNSGTVSNLTMNVNVTGAKPIKFINNGTLGDLASAGYLKANTKYPFYYDGANWVVWMNVDSTYSDVATEVTAQEILRREEDGLALMEFALRALDNRLDTMVTDLPHDTTGQQLAEALNFGNSMLNALYNELANEEV